MNFPKVIIQHKHESESFAIILYQLRELGIFRNITESDYGIDFEMEIVNGDRVEGHCIKVQVKSSDKLTVGKRNGHAIVGGIKQSTLCYWAELSYNVPVIAIAVDVKKETIYITEPIFWQAISLIDATEKEKRPKSKSIDFGKLCDVDETIRRLKKIAYGYGLREELNAHKWLLRNMINILSLYENATICHNGYSKEDDDIFRTFLECAKILLGIKSYPGDREMKKIEQVFDYETLKNSTCSMEIGYDDVKTVMNEIFPSLMPQLDRYKDRVLKSAYYWLYKDPLYLKLVITTDIPNGKDYSELCEYGRRNPYDHERERQQELYRVVDNLERRYGLQNNEFFRKINSL